MVALADCAVEDTEVGYNTTEGVEHRVKNQSLQRAIVVALGCGNTLHDSLQDILHAQTCLTRCQKDILVLATDKVDNLVLHLVNHSRLNVNLIQHGDNLEVVADSEVEVRYGLRLNTLRSIYYKQCALARGDGT